jgi:hypothetical protein
MASNDGPPSIPFLDSQPTLKAENTRIRMMTGRRVEFAILSAAVILAAAALFAACSEKADQEPEPTSATSAPTRVEEPPLPTEQEQISGQKLKLQNWQDWWHHAREVLFKDIPLSPEEAQAIDAVIARELNMGAELQQRDAELKAARKARDSARVDAARTALGESRAQLKKTHEIYEELRALLSEEQRPAFDMNRAHHVAESQAPVQAQQSETEAE